MTIRKLQTNFTAGELAPDIAGRTDIALYQNGAALARNVRTMPGGGLRRRGGLAFCAELPDIPYQHNEWIFNVDQTYQLLFSYTRVDVFDGVSGILLQAITGAPWGNSEIGHMSVYCQGDFAFICHPDINPYQIRRTGSTTFVLEVFRFERPELGAEQPIWQPYFRYFPNDYALRVEAITGYSTAGWVAGATADIMASFDIFRPEYINTMLVIEDAQWEIISIVDSHHCVGFLRSSHFRVHLTANAFTITQGNSTVTVYDPFHDYGVGDDIVIANAVPFNTLLYANVNGIREITGFGDATWSYDSGATPPTSSEVGGGPNAMYWSNEVRTANWKEQMYSPFRGWPHCVGGFQTRLIFGGGRSSPNRINFSRVDAPFNFDVGIGADNEAILVGVSGRRTPTIRSVIGSDHVQIFSDEGEYYIPRTEDASALTPSTIAVIPQTFYGTQPGTFPVEFDGATLFVSLNGSHLRQLVFGEKGYNAADLSFVSHHLLRQPHWLAVQMEDADQAAATALIVNSDGTVATLTMMRSEKVAAWALSTTQGTFSTACSVNSRAFFVVRRQVAGVWRAFLEKLDRNRLLDGSLMGVFVGKVGQAYSWDGFGKYVGQPINIIVDGRSDIGLFTPDGLGRVYIPVRATSVEGGFGFTPQIRTLPPEIVLPNGPSQGEMRRVITAHLKVLDTIGLKVRKTKVLNTQAQNDLGIADQLHSGSVMVYMLGWDDIGQVDITQFANGPFTILSANLDLEF